MIRTVEQNEIYSKLKKKQPNDVQWLHCCSVLSFLLSLFNFAYWHVISLKLLLLNVFMKTSFYWITVKVKARENAVLFTIKASKSMLFDVEQSQRIWFLLNSAISCSSQFLVTLNSNKNASHVYRVATTNPISRIVVECKLFFAPHWHIIQYNCKIGFMKSGFVYSVLLISL